MATDQTYSIRRLETVEESEQCARIMVSSEPWITLGRGYDACLAVIRDPAREVYVAVQAGAVSGFIVLNMAGAFVGYIQTVAVRQDLRDSGIGSGLISFAEQRIFRDSPNAFMCVSSFNGRARSLYERLGYTVVGELRDYIVAGHSEYLLRKTIGPLSSFSRG